MSRLIYTALTSLDGYIADEAGNFDWAVRRIKAHSSREVAVGGPTLAAHALRLGLVDEYHFFVAPIIVGGGLPLLPSNVRVTLELLDERRFDNGMVHLHYRATRS